MGKEKCLICGKKTGVVTAENGLSKWFCRCETGRKLLKEINENGKKCPICSNTGIWNLNFCRCVHGLESRVKALKNPNECQICHGKGEILIFPTNSYQKCHHLEEFLFF